MKCPKCGGAGEMQICEMGFIGKDECDKCHGKGYLTNEQWLRQCTTEQLAECIIGVDYGADDKATKIEKLKEWLNQPHTFE